MNRIAVILAAATAALTASCTAIPSADDHLAPVPGEIVVEAGCYGAHVNCQVANASSVEKARAVLVSDDGTRETEATIAGGWLHANLDRLQSGTVYSVHFTLSAGNHSLDSKTQNFSTNQGPMAIYPKDAVFEKYLLEHHDTNGDGILTVDEARRITGIDIRTDSISSMDEIRCMPNLFYLDIRNSEEKPGLLTHLDLSGCPNLIRLNCDWNRIESLDISGCPHLEYLYCWRNSITEIDLSANPELLEINLDSNLLSSIDISAQDKLRCLNIGNNRAIRSIKVPHPENLLNFSIGDTRITEFDLSTMPALEVYGGNNLPINFVPDMKSHPHMREMHLCCEGGAFWLDDPDYFTGFEDMESLNICGYRLDHVDLSKNKKLHMLWISIANNLTELDISTAPDMEVLEFSDCEKLERIYVHPDVVIEDLKILRGSCKAVICHKPQD